MRRSGRGAAWALAGVLALSAGCTPKAPPASPSAPKYTDFMYPAVPPALKTSAAAAAVDRGWSALQRDDLRNAEREFAAAVKQNGAFYPARAAQGYLALARKNYDDALQAFGAALEANRDYVPALVGRGQASLAANRDAQALEAFERAVTLDPSLTDLRSRIEVLRFRNVQDVIARAQAAAKAGRVDEARLAYERAIAASPDSAFLYHELGLLERKQGDNDRALDHLRKAVDLDPGDGSAWVEVGAILEERQDFDGAVAAYRRAVPLLDAPGEVQAKIAAASAKGRDARLPAEFKAIAQAPQVTRADLAALLGIRLEPVLASAPARQVVATDVRTSWAAPWIAAVLNAGVMEAFENHTFQPQNRIRRGDLARAVSRVVALMAPQHPELRQAMGERPRIADMSTTHLDYPAAAVAVAAGILPLTDGRFQVGRQVTGAEAVEAVARLQRLAGLR